MPQEIEKGKTLSTANTVRKGGKVLPQEPVDIYAVKSKSGAHLGEPGTKHTVHAVLAHKLVAKGAATLTAPKAADKPKLSKAELDALKAELGRKPTDEEIEAAIEAKTEGGDENEDL